jgi:hypothetical protein
MRFVIWTLVGAAIAAAGIKGVQLLILPVGIFLYVAGFAAAVIFAIASNFGRGRREHIETFGLRGPGTHGHMEQTFQPWPRLGPMATGFAVCALGIWWLVIVR